MKYTLLLWLLISFIYTSNGQNSIKGKIIDSLTHEPISFASVYFANTTYGTSTDDNGHFILKNFPDGKYDLTVSFIGYRTVQVATEFSNTSSEFNFKLIPKPTELNEIVITPDTSDRTFAIKQFKRVFLGTTKNASSCKITNLKNLHIYFDRENRIITAFSKKPLEIINQALGYKIVYDLHLFELDYGNQRETYLGVPRFELLTAKNNAQQRHWDKERRKAYQGSFVHFIRLLQQGNLSDEFEVQELFRIPNPARPITNAALNEKIRMWRLKAFNADNHIISSTAHDSLTYYLNLKQKPELIDSLGKIITHVDTLLNAQRNKILYTGILRITYKKEHEDRLYAQLNWRTPLREQQSLIHILAPITLYGNGYYEDVQNIFFEGYMAWSEKMADTLPLSYTLPTDEEN